jgi:hypothetical protein
VSKKIHGLCCDCTDGDLGAHCEGHFETRLGPCIECPNDASHFAERDYDHTYYCSTCAKVSRWGQQEGPTYIWPA